MSSYTRLNPGIIEQPFSGTTDANGNLNLEATTDSYRLVGLECTRRTLPHVYHSIWFATVYNDNLTLAANTAVSGKLYLVEKS